MYPKLESTKQTYKTKIQNQEAERVMKSEKNLQQEAEEEEAEDEERDWKEGIDQEVMVSTYNWSHKILYLHLMFEFLAQFHTL